MTTAPKPHHAANPKLVNIIDHVRAHGPCLYTDLYALFGSDVDPDDSKLSHAKFRKRLEYLCYTDQLQGSSLTRGNRRTYKLGHLADQQARPLSAAAVAPPSGSDVPVDDVQPEYVEEFSPVRVPPRQYDVMHGSFTYTLAPPVRPGAMDHKRYDTHGVFC